MAAGNYRPLTGQERELIVWLLEHGPSDAKNFLPQLDVMPARSSCDCGCPSIEFSVPLEAPYIETPLGTRACFTGVTKGYEAGLMLTAGSGALSELDYHSVNSEKCQTIGDNPEIDGQLTISAQSAH